MISTLTGTKIGSDQRSLTLDVHGVGFRVFTLPSAIQSTEIHATVTLYTHLHVREDALELYGFLQMSELTFFQKLLTVSGVGPRMALGVLSAARVEDLQHAIDQGQSSLLTKVSGVGKKTAERIIVDLRGKLSEDISAGDAGLGEVIDALVQLGYSTREAREAAVSTPPDFPVEARIKAALKHMA